MRIVPARAMRACSFIAGRRHILCKGTANRRQYKINGRETVSNNINKVQFAPVIANLCSACTFARANAERPFPACKIGVSCPNGLFRAAIWAVSSCDMGRFRLRYGPFQAARQTVSQAGNGCFASCLSVFVCLNISKSILLWHRLSRKSVSFAALKGEKVA